jgi:hypothetical protein
MRDLTSIEVESVAGGGWVTEAAKLFLRGVAEGASWDLTKYLAGLKIEGRDLTEQEKANIAAEVENGKQYSEQSGPGGGEYNNGGDASDPFGEKPNQTPEGSPVF